MISKEDVKHIAHLARFKLSDEEIELFTHQLAKILQYMEQLNELETTSIQPLYHVVDIKCRLRGDEISLNVEPSRIIKNAPESEGDFFKVKKIIE
jgi:aspartyl-tRNA(Asn)/glutamyl-tRNA(Gln) amidotransferase subunit C